MLPQLARGDSNKMWIIPSEVTDALRGISGALGGQQQGVEGADDDDWVDPGPEDDAFADTSLQYCATCQTGGKPLADRRLSKLLR